MVAPPPHSSSSSSGPTTVPPPGPTVVPPESPPSVTTGSGSGEPWGIVTRLAATTASRVDAAVNGAFSAVDIFAMVNDLPARAQANAQWVSHWGVQNLVRQFTSGSSPTAANYWTDLGSGTPPNLLGVPIHKSSAMRSSLSAATASNDDVLVLGDFSRFLIVDALGPTIVHNPIVLGSNRRPSGEV
ncbi:MAG: phage major capsid protein [Planctomycetes bacterium]|nr:phage major capsid protein [Planctomycetota bacterium]